MGAPLQLKLMVRELSLEPAVDRLQYFAEHARRLATRLEKQITVQVDHGRGYLDGRPWPRFWAAFTHGLRNAIDHGIEQPNERRAIGKAEEGRIALRALQTDTSIIFEIADDGRGIDWEAVRARCAASGLSAASQEDLVAGLFADGVSTAHEVTDISSRGVGMGALRSAVQDLGGCVNVLSEVGRGTTVRMSSPLYDSTSDLAVLVAQPARSTPGSTVPSCRA